MYNFDYDDRRRMLTATISGLLSPDAALAFASELREQIASATRGGANLRILFDASRAPVQQLASFSALASLGATFPDPPRSAVVLSSVLAKMQAVRGISSDSVRIFRTVSAALEWLLEPVTENS
jgi:hypothetical protein